MRSVSRRSFMKTAAVAGAVAAFPEILVRRACAELAKKTAIHPNVDNLRVVGITDPRMTTGLDAASTWARQEELVDKEVVWANLDKLACGLAQTKTSADAWKTIFVKPAGKSWSDTVVAIKTNNIAQQHTRSAVMAGLCHALTDVVGVKPGNIHIYDGCHGGSLQKETPFAGLPEGCCIENNWGGINTLTSIPSLWPDPEGKSKCVKALVDGSVDILVNLSMCKGHGDQFGKFTMTMKNHFGTFNPKPGHSANPLEYLIAINQTPEVLGAMDGTGKVLYPRQQLCLVDALWASKGGPGGLPTDQPNFLAMGVLPPVVDYQVATKFRKGVMGWNINMNAVDRFLSEFGYSAGDLPQGGGIIPA